MRAAMHAVPVLALAFAAHAAPFDRFAGNRFDPATIARALPPEAAPTSREGGLDTSVTHAPIALSDRPSFAAPHRADLPLLGPAPAPPPSGSGLTIGPIRAEMIGKTSPRTGRASFKPHYTLNGVTVLGGAVGGSLDTRGGMLTLQWRTAP